MENTESSPFEGGFVASALDKVSDLTADSITYIEESTRHSPLKAIGLAVGAGYLLRNLPIFGLFGVFFRLALLLVRPAALVFGGIKVCQFLSESGASKPAE